MLRQQKEQERLFISYYRVNNRQWAIGNWQGFLNFGIAYCPLSIAYCLLPIGVDLAQTSFHTSQVSILCHERERISDR
jgi:hypothetical protein